MSDYPHIELLKRLTGIETADCRTCRHGHMDTDGEPGATFECGCECSKIEARKDADSLPSYAFEMGIDEDAEKPCWEPEFYSAKSDPDDEWREDEDFHEWENRAHGKFLERITPYLPDPPIQPVITI